MQSHGENYAPEGDEHSGPEGYHIPVLRAEAVDCLEPQKGKLIVDATLGGGGHAEALLERGAVVIGLDQDPDAIDFASERLKRFGDQFHAFHCNFADADAALDRYSVPLIDGVLLDIGVSSHQLDIAERGFSFRESGPLDMRMNPEGKVTAAELVNTMSGEHLERIFRTLGEEPAARRVAIRIVRERSVRPLSTTGDLARLVEGVIPRRGKTHPATKVFQALRMAVNHELESLEAGLKLFSRRLATGGRMAVISFHSLEDRLVKQFFRDRSTEWLDRPEWPEPRRNPALIFRKVTGKAIVATEAEQRRNPRSRTAKLRAVEKL